jgi:hypothetical protein
MHHPNQLDKEENIMQVGVQFSGTLAPGENQLWFTYGWPQEWYVVWNVVSTTPVPGAPQVEWDIEVERASDTDITYWLSITDVSGNPTNFEARYAIMNI